MDIEDALVTYLLGQSTLTAYIDRRLYAQGKVPANEQMPYVVRSEVSNVFSHTHDGQSTLEQPNRQLSVKAVTENESKAIAGVIKTLLKDYRGTLSGFDVQWIKIINKLTMPEVIAEGIVSITTDVEIDISYINA